MNSKTSYNIPEEFQRIELRWEDLLQLFRGQNEAVDVALLMSYVMAQMGQEEGGFIANMDVAPTGQFRIMIHSRCNVGEDFLESALQMSQDSDYSSEEFLDVLTEINTDDRFKHLIEALKEFRE